MTLLLEALRVVVPGRILFDHLDLSIVSGQSVAVLGSSGSGKTTLLNTAAGIRKPSSGSVWFAGADLFASSAASRSRTRLSSMGLIFQFSELLPELTVVENVALPLRLAGRTKGDATEAAVTHLEALGLADAAGRPTTTLSGGEQQRVGIARATVHGPRLILADEPTGMLDDANSDLVMELMLAQVAEIGAALLLVTHDTRVGSMADESYNASDGGLEPVTRFRS